jgi:hypothetical protein
MLNGWWYRSLGKKLFPSPVVEPIIAGLHQSSQSGEKYSLEISALSLHLLADACPHRSHKVDWLIADLFRHRTTQLAVAGARLPAELPHRRNAGALRCRETGFDHFPKILGAPHPALGENLFPRTSTPDIGTSDRHRLLADAGTVSQGIRPIGRSGEPGLGSAGHDLRTEPNPIQRSCVSGGLRKR